MTEGAAHDRLGDVPQAKNKENESEPGELPIASPGLTKAASVPCSGSRDNEARDWDLEVDSDVHPVIEDRCRSCSRSDLVFEALDAVSSITNAGGCVLELLIHSLETKSFESP